MTEIFYVVSIVGMIVMFFIILRDIIKEIDNDLFNDKY